MPNFNIFIEAPRFKKMARRAHSWSNIVANKHNVKTRETQQTMAARRPPPPADPTNANYQPVGIQRRRSNGNDRIADNGDASAATAANGNSNYNPADAGIQRKLCCARIRALPLPPPLLWKLKVRIIRFTLFSPSSRRSDSHISPDSRIPSVLIPRWGLCGFLILSLPRRRAGSGLLRGRTPGTASAASPARRVSFSPAA